jgi:PAS domain S-box-containing protein
MITLDDRGSDTILVVDDEPASRGLLRRMLEAEGYRVEEASGGLQALEQYGRRRPSLVLIDALMPGMNGFEFCSELRKLPRNEQVPAVMITALDDQASIDRAYEAGAADFVTKPVHWPILRQRLRRLVLAEHAERELEARHNLLRTLIDNMPDYIYVKDAQSRYLISNVAYARLVGFENTSDVIGKTDRELFPEELASDYLTSDQAILKSGQPLVNREQLARDKAGHDVYALTTKVPLRDGTGQVVGLVGMSRDITERKRAELAILSSEAVEHQQRLLVEALHEELRRHAEELEQRVDERTKALNRAKEHVEAILNSSSEAILVVRTNGAISRGNPACSELFGYPVDEIIQRPLTALIQPDHVERLVSALASAVTSGSSIRIEIEACHKDRTTFLADVGLSPIVVHGEGTTLLETAEVVCSIHDITKRKQAERELQELNKLKTEFLTTAAHELRTPLASILGFSEILLVREMGADRAKRFIQIIHEQSLQLRKIIDSLLDISRIEAKQGLTLDFQPLNLASFVTEILTHFADVLPKYQFPTEGLAECPTIAADPFRLGQVFHNIISNALKYSPNGGPITIRSQMIPGFVQVSIQDKGIGMTPEQQAHLFERFYRADTSNTTLSSAGLGLSISKLIVEQHGGRIWAESAHGLGTTMYFTLPLAPKSTSQMSG